MLPVNPWGLLKHLCSAGLWPSLACHRWSNAIPVHLFGLLLYNIWKKNWISSHFLWHCLEVDHSDVSEWNANHSFSKPKCDFWLIFCKPWLLWLLPSCISSPSSSRKCNGKRNPDNYIQMAPSHDFSSVWWLIFLCYNWYKLNCSHPLHMDYIVSAAAVRAAHLLGERPCWQYSLYLPGTRCKGHWGPRDPPEFAGDPMKCLGSPQPRFILSVWWQSRLGSNFFFIFSHAGSSSLFQLELWDLFWDWCVQGERDWVCQRRKGRETSLHSAYPWKSVFSLFLSHKCLIFLLKRIRKAVVSLNHTQDPAQLQWQPPRPTQNCCHLSLFKPGTVLQPQETWSSAELGDNIF